MLKQVKNTGYVFAAKAALDFVTGHIKILIKHLVNLKQLRMKQSMFAAAPNQKTALSVMVLITANCINKKPPSGGFFY